MQSTAGIALLGCGTVGGAIAERLLHRHDLVKRRTGVDYILRGIAVRDPQKSRAGNFPAELFTVAPNALIDDSNVDIVIECIGGTAIASELVERAIDRGHHVITANAELIATQGPRLRALAAQRGVTLRYEAAVADAIPIVRVLETSLAGETIDSIVGIVGQNDIVAAQQLAILVQLAFGQAVISPRVRRSGDDAIPTEDITVAARANHTVKLLAYALRNVSGCSAEVALAWVRNDHPFARVAEGANAVYVNARDAGELFFSGSQSGGGAVAASLFADTIATLRAIGERQIFGARSRSAVELEPAIDVAPAFDAFERAARFATVYDAIAAERTLRAHSVAADGTATLTGTPLVRYRPDSRYDARAIRRALADADCAPVSIFPIWNDTHLTAPATPLIAAHSTPAQ